MVHFTIDCSESILINNSPELIMKKVYDSAIESGLIKSSDINIKIIPHMYYRTGNSIRPFIHITVNIFKGRSAEQKDMLSQTIQTQLEQLLEEGYRFTVSYVDLDKNAYFTTSIDS